MRKVRNCAMALGFIGVLSAALTGCGAHQDEEVVFLVGRSGSEKSQTMLRRQMAAISEIVDALPRGTNITVLRFDTSVHQISGGAWRNGNAVFSLEDELKPAQTRPGSRLDLALTEVLKRLQRNPQLTIRAITVSDGENTGGKLEPILTHLAANHRLRALWMTGLDQRFHLVREQQLAPLGRRALAGNWKDFDADLKSFRHANG